jgi:hypothetical protein
MTCRVVDDATVGMSVDWRRQLIDKDERKWGNTMRLQLLTWLQSWRSTFFYYAFLEVQNYSIIKVQRFC